jgi:hypothetical protein
MTTPRLLTAGPAAILGLVLFLDPAHALTRTFVSAGGSDVNPCTAASPCASFQTAHNFTNTNGELTCLDAGDFGGININRSLTIDCAGGLGASSGTITVNGSNVVVRLRNLTLNGLGTGTIGVSFVSGTALFIENCAILGYNGGAAGQGIGVKFAPSAGLTELYVTESWIGGNGRAADGGGIVIQPTGSAQVRVTIEGSQVLDNTFGIFANGSGTTGLIATQIRDTIVAGSAFHGISAFTNAATASITTDRTSALLNGQAGILAQGSGGFVFLANSTVISNGTGLSAAAGGHIFSYQNNHLSGNVSDGAPTAVLTVK